MDISIVIVAFKSDHILENLISKIPNHYEIIVVENSLQYKTKTYLESKFQNTKVLIPNENLGYSAGVNLGIEKSSKDFIFIVTADVNFSCDMLQKLEGCIKKFHDFTLLAPVYKNSTVHKNFKIFHKNKVNKIYVENYNLIEVDEIDGACFLINKKEFSSNKIMDENFFLYFDSTDLCHQLKKKGKKMYIVENLNFIHKGTASSEKDYKFEILINRNWHYSWSKFYFYKKNYSYLFALRKISPNFFRSLFNYLYFKFTLDKNKASLNKAILSGILNSVLLKKSLYRPNIEIR